jgi:hypothetical protein
MAKVADMLMEAFRGEITAPAKRDITAAQAAAHVEYWAGAASFAVMQTKRMAAQLRERYLA